MTHGYGKNWDPAEHYREAEVAETYDAERFTSLAGRVFNSLEKRLIRKAFTGVPAGATIGDVPCGTGRLAEVLLGRGFDVTGVDISPAMLRVAKSRLQRFGDKFQIRVLDARQLSDETVRFDAALCARVLMHFPLSEQITFLRNVASVTKGRLVFTQGVLTPYHRLRRLVKRVLLRENPAVYPLRPEEIRRLLAGAGLRLVKQYAVLPLLSESRVFVTEKVLAQK